MKGRIAEICANIPKVSTLADIGCDHGYCTKYAFDHKLCERAVISDISAGSLQKARRLLKKEIDGGVCTSVVCDGLDGVGRADFVLIAGMGGEEIIAILSRCDLPERFLLQPMRNSNKVRAFLLGRGAKIGRDYTFRDGDYFYDLITGTRAGGDEYAEYELLFGRENLTKPSRDFADKLFCERAKVRERLARKMSAKSRSELLARLNFLEVVIDAGEDYFVGKKEDYFRRTV